MPQGDIGSSRYCSDHTFSAYSWLLLHKVMNSKKPNLVALLDPADVTNMALSVYPCARTAFHYMAYGLSDYAA